jgi:hypothetical protein
MHQITQEHSPIQIGALQVAIAVCLLATTFINLSTSMLPYENMRFWFLLDGLGYLSLFTVFFLPRFAPKHHMISFLLMGYALLSIVLWFILGQPDEIVGYITNPIGLVLAVLAFYEGWRALRTFTQPQA